MHRICLGPEQKPINLSMGSGKVKLLYYVWLPEASGLPAVTCRPELGTQRAQATATESDES